MTRSVWKGPFVDGFLIKKVTKILASGKREVVKIWSRRSTILPQFRPKLWLVLIGGGEMGSMYVQS